MFIETRFKKLCERIPGNIPMPLRIVLWDGRVFNFSPTPTVTIHVPKLAALRYFIAPDLQRLGEAFVEGHIRAEGSIHELCRVADSLVNTIAAHTRMRFHRFAHHSHRQDREAIQYHYDVSNEFYSLFLDAQIKCVSGACLQNRHQRGLPAAAHA